MTSRFDNKTSISLHHSRIWFLGTTHQMEVSCLLDDYAALAGLAVPVPNRERNRLRIVRESNILDGNVTDEDYDRLTALAARVLKVPICLMTIVEADTVWTKSQIGLKSAPVHRNDGLCSYVVLEDAPDCMQVPDTLKDTRFQHIPAVAGPPYFRYYAGAAIKVGGEKMGSFCILDTAPRTALNDTQKEILMGIASIVSQTLTKRHEMMMQKALEGTKLAMSIVYNVQLPIQIISKLNSTLIKEFHQFVSCQSLGNESDVSKFQQKVVQFNCSIQQLGALIESSLNCAHIRTMERCDITKYLATVQDTVQHLLVTSQCCDVHWLIMQNLFQNKVHFTFPHALHQALLCCVFNLSLQWVDITVSVGFESSSSQEGEDPNTEGSGIVIQIIGRRTRAVPPHTAQSPDREADAALGFLVAQSVLSSVGGTFHSALQSTADDASPLFLTPAVVDKSCADTLAQEVETLPKGVQLPDTKMSATFDSVRRQCTCTMTIPCLLLPKSATVRK